MLTDAFSSLAYGLFYMYQTEEIKISTRELNGLSRLKVLSLNSISHNHLIRMIMAELSGHVESLIRDFQ